MAQFTGDVTIKVDGQTVLTKQGSGTLNVATKNRNEIIADGEVQGFYEEGRAVIVTCTMSHNSDLDIIALAATQAAKVLFETDHGTRYLVREAFCVSDVELSGGGGDTTIEFRGKGVERL